MKNFLILLICIFLFSCKSQKVNVVQKEKNKEIIEVPKIEKKVTQKVIEITAKKNAQGYLLGTANKASFKDESFNYWFDSRYEEFETNKDIISKLKPILKDFTIIGFMGTWCGDSRREVPKFYKILDETGFNQNNFKLICVDRSKTTPDHKEKGLNIIRVPTFIFYKEGKEIGRFVEYPRETIEEDILKIVTQKPYKHSYDRSK
jgi:thiol-disulfide isomerase/thioredoxin